jgi:hypothetical protein
LLIGRSRDERNNQIKISLSIGTIVVAGKGATHFMGWQPSSRYSPPKDGGENQNTIAINVRFHQTGGTSVSAQIVFQISACFFGVICAPVMLPLDPQLVN